MTKIKTVEDLFQSELFDMYNAEKQITVALPKMAEKASDKKLAQAFETHLEETRGQIERLDKVFQILDLDPETEECEAMQGLLEEGGQLMKDVEQGPVLDAALIAAAQKVEHYEIATYGCLCALAKGLGYDEALDLLAETLEEEKSTDEKLTQLAEKGVNQKALREAA